MLFFLFTCTQSGLVTTPETVKAIPSTFSATICMKAFCTAITHLRDLALKCNQISRLTEENLQK